jgi:hypothetical protein
MEMKASATLVYMLLALVLAIQLVLYNPVLATPSNWSEVTRFTGTGSREPQNTTFFTADHPEWRIRWEYNPYPEYVNVASFVALTYPQGETSNYVDSIVAMGPSQTSGTSYVHNRTGTFYMNIIAGDNVLNYTLIVEQDLDSIPEFLLPMLLPLLLTSTLVIATVCMCANKPKPTKTSIRVKTN